MAYSTAQEAKGIFYIDNLVLLGAPFNANGGRGRNSNIGHIWDLAWYEDKVKNNATIMFTNWERYNNGEYGGVYIPDLDIYQHGATRCFMVGSGNIPGNHGGVGDYFDPSNPIGFMSCSNNTFYVPKTEDMSRLEFLLGFLSDIVGVGTSR